MDLLIQKNHENQIQKNQENWAITNWMKDTSFILLLSKYGKIKLKVNFKLKLNNLSKQDILKIKVVLRKKLRKDEIIQKKYNRSYCCKKRQN